jgi:hypothetical protein
LEPLMGWSLWTVMRDLIAIKTVCCGLVRGGWMGIVGCSNGNDCDGSMF